MTCIVESCWKGGSLSYPGVSETGQKMTLADPGCLERKGTVFWQSAQLAVSKYGNVKCRESGFGRCVSGMCVNACGIWLCSISWLARPLYKSEDIVSHVLGMSHTRVTYIMCSSIFCLGLYLPASLPSSLPPYLLTSYLLKPRSFLFQVLFLSSTHI